MSEARIRIFLHLGLHKTATTHLQWALNRTRAHLAGHGVLYPETGRSLSDDPTAPDAQSGHAMLYRRLMSQDTGARDALLDELGREIAESGAETVLLSSETFLTPPHPAPPVVLKHAFGRFGQITPLVYVRRQDHLAPSIYTELLGWSRLGLTASFRQFLRGRAGRQWLDLDTRLAPLRDGFGKRFLVRSFDDLNGPNGVYEDVCRLIGLPDIAPLPPRIVYPSVNPALVNLLRAINGEDSLSFAQKRALVFRLKTDPAFAATQEERQGTLLSHANYRWLAERYGPRNRRMSQHLMLGGPAAKFRFPAEDPALPSLPQRYSLQQARALLPDLAAALPDAGPQAGSD